MNVLVVFICCLAVYEFTLRLSSTFPGSFLWSSGVSTSPSCGRLCPYHLLFRRFITEPGVCTHSNPVLGGVFSACVDRLSLCHLLFRPSISESYYLLFRCFITESGVCTHSNPVLGVVFSACVDHLSRCRLLYRPLKFISESGVCTHSNPVLGVSFSASDDLTCDCDVLDCNCSVYSSIH